MKKKNINEFNQVKTSLEFDVKEVITKRVEEALLNVVDECSQEFNRNLEVLFTVEMD